MKFTPDHYLDASREQIDAARRLHNSRHYPAAVYLAGVSVECLLLAYRTRENRAFESRHDLRDLFKESGMAEFIRRKDRKYATAILGEIWSRWKNNYRFASHTRLISEFKRLQLDRGIKGDAVKWNASVIIEKSFEIINLGARRWNSKKNWK